MEIPPHGHALRSPTSETSSIYHRLALLFSKPPRAISLRPSRTRLAVEVVDVRERALLDHHLVGVEDVVHVEVLDVSLHNLGHVPGGEGDVFRRILGDDVRLLALRDAPRLERARHRLGLRRGSREGVHDDHGGRGSRGLDSGGHRESPLLLVHLDGPILGLWAEDDAAAGLERGTGGARARVAGALLLEGLAATAANLALGERGRGSPTRVLAHHHHVLVHQALGDVRLGHLDVERGGARGGAVEVNLGHLGGESLHGHGGASDC